MVNHEEACSLFLRIKRTGNTNTSKMDISSGRKFHKEIHSTTITYKGAPESIGEAKKHVPDSV